MAFRKRKFAPKRKMGRKFGRRKATALVNRALHPIPQRFFTKMKYCETVNSDTSGMYRFNLNSLFDPNQTGIGHQPYGFDTLATLYNRYRVISCGYRITANTTGATAANSVHIASIPANEALTFVTMSEIKENPRAKYIIQTAGGGSVVLSGKTYIPSLVGRNKAQYMADDRYQAVVTGSPQELAILNVVTSNNALGVDAPNQVTFNILLEYTVEWFDIKHLVQS